MDPISVIQPKRPIHGRWHRLVLPPQFIRQHGGYPIEAWECLTDQGKSFRVLSAVEYAPEPGQADIGPEFHLSVTVKGGRCDSAEALWVLTQFDLADAKEDNHVPGGIARNFWRPVADRFSGYECPCVELEPAIREDKGDFIWRP